MKETVATQVFNAKLFAAEKTVSRPINFCSRRILTFADDRNLRFEGNAFFGRKKRFWCKKFGRDKCQRREVVTKRWCSSSSQFLSTTVKDRFKCELSHNNSNRTTTTFNNNSSTTFNNITNNIVNNGNDFASLSYLHLSSVFFAGTALSRTGTRVNLEFVFSGQPR